MTKELKHKLEIIEEKSLSKSDDALIRKLLVDCFPEDVAVFSKSRNWHGTDPEYIILNRKGKEIVGHVAVVLREITCGRARVTIAGIQSLAVRPECRGTGLSQTLMTRSMSEAWQRGIKFGLLFCVPNLERFYASLGWRRIDGPFFMRDESGRKTSTPQKNIGMILLLSGAQFPPGAIDLRGRDW